MITKIMLEVLKYFDYRGEQLQHYSHVEDEKPFSKYNIFAWNTLLVKTKVATFFATPEKR